MNRSGTRHGAATGVRVVIEVPKGGRIKWSAKGRMEFVSPIACPFNYGSISEMVGSDGDPWDVVVLGPKLPRGSRHTVEIIGRVGFRDAGLADDKWVGRPMPVGNVDPVTDREKRAIERFFHVYGLVKRLAHCFKRTAGTTGFQGANWGSDVWMSTYLG